VFFLNSNLIERVDSTPDTIVTLVDGKKYVVAETLTQVLDAVVAFRGEIVALGSLLDAVHPLVGRTRPEERPRLAAVTSMPGPREPEDTHHLDGDA